MEPVANCQILHYHRRTEIAALLKAQQTELEIILHFGIGTYGKTRKMVKWHMNHIKRS